jgi:hypothetical protein
VHAEKDKEVNDCRLIVQNIVYGTKTLLFSILYCTRQIYLLQNPQAQLQNVAQEAAPNLPPVGMHTADVRCCGRMLLYGLKCLKVASSAE